MSPRVCPSFHSTLHGTLSLLSIFFPMTKFLTVLLKSMYVSPSPKPSEARHRGSRTRAVTCAQTPHSSSTPAGWVRTRGSEQRCARLHRTATFHAAAHVALTCRCLSPPSVTAESTEHTHTCPSCFSPNTQASGSLHPASAWSFRLPSIRTSGQLWIPPSTTVPEIRQSHSLASTFPSFLLNTRSCVPYPFMPKPKKAHLPPRVLCFPPSTPATKL